MKQEFWHFIVGYEGLYIVSNYGRIKNFKTGKFLKLIKSNNLYLKVNLYKEGIMKTHSVHKLVAVAFIPNPYNLPQVNHKDEDKTNNFVFINPDGSVDNEKSNLEWCTASYNTNYGTRTKRASKSQFNRPDKSKAVNQFDLNWNLLNTWESAKEAQRKLPHVYQEAVSDCCNGKRITHAGCYWKFVE